MLLSLWLRKINQLDNNTLPQIRNHRDEAHTILFFYLLHAGRQIMFNPPVLHKFFHYPTKITKNIVKERIIARQR
jgi:hypothetical protein